MKTVLSVGDAGDEVAAVHKRLESHGFSVPAAEVERKFFGPGTRAVLGEFQRTMGIGETCQLCEKTADVLAAAPSSPEASIDGQPQLATGLSLTGLSAGAGLISTQQPGSSLPVSRPDLGVRRKGTTLETPTRQLSFGMRDDDVARVQQAIKALGRQVPADEAEDQRLGPGTLSLVKGIQTELGLPDTGIVDAATVSAINDKLSKLETDPRIIRGFVSGNGVSGGLVQIFMQVPNGEEVIGKSPINATDGSYQISYQPPPNGRVDLRVAVMDSNGGIVETTPSGASILTKAGRLEVVNFVLSGAANQPLSEFELILADLDPFLGDRILADLTEEEGRREISILASRSGYSSDQIAALVAAHKLEKDTKTPAPLFYGFIRQGMPRNVNALQAADPHVRLKALKVAVEQGLVPKELGGKKIEEHLSGFMPLAATGDLQSLLGRVLSPTELNTFVNQFIKDSQNPDAFWNRVATEPALATRAAELKLTVQLGALTNNHVPLVAVIRALPNVKKAADLVRITKDRWKSLIKAQAVGVPPDTPGATAGEKTDNYVKQIVSQVEAAFPTQFFAERLGASQVATLLPVAGFLKAHPSYDLKTTYPAQFFKTNPTAAQALTPQDRDRLQTCQRLYRLTESAEETVGLSAKGIHSSQQIARIDPAVFADQLKGVLSADRAKTVHDKALRTSAIALALAGEYGASLNRTGLQALPKPDMKKQAANALDKIPNWETLFGALDFCACKECSSAHGPAAYFVDILQFLGERGARAALFERRTDLGDIELSCENTNTVLPLIDLVNEVLENAVSPPAPFAPFALAPALEADLAQTVATAALTAAFNPRLQLGAQVETVEAGKRWRIWDEAFAFNVVKENNAINVVAPSRQTTGPAEERRTTPQYRNSAAYGELSRAVFPWNLPFDLPNDEAKVFLTHLGVSRGELIEALRPVPEPFDPNSPIVVRIATERLGLTDTERKIIVGEPLTPPRPLEDFWGSAPGEMFSTVQELLDRSGLSYAELDALVATWFINPTNTLTISAKSGAPVDTCNPTNLQVNGLNADVLSRLHRFVRLWGSVGWTIPELDRTIRAFAPDPNTPVLNNTILVRLDHLRTLSSWLRLPVAQTLALWKPIDTTEPGSLYWSLFYNAAVFKPQHEDFRLRPDGLELVRVDRFLAEHAAAVQAALRLSAANFGLLAAKTNGRLSLTSLSVIYRHATMARQLGLTVEDLLTAIELTGLDPFRADRSQNALRFVEAVRAIRTSGFAFPQLDYLLRHRFNTAASFVPVDSTLAQTLTEVRAGLPEVDAPSEAERQALRETLVVDRIAAGLELPADVTGALLGRVSHGGKAALLRFIALSAIPGTEPLSRANAKPQFETLEKLLKIATIIKTLKLPGSQLDWLFRENPWLGLAPDPAGVPVPLESWFSLIGFQGLRRDLNLEDAALEAILSAITGVVAATGQPARLAARKAFVDALSFWFGWPQTDLEALIGNSENLDDLGLLNVRVPEDYLVDLIVRLHRAMSLLKRLGVTAAHTSEWCEASVTDSNAKAIRRAAKARHDDNAWQKIAIPLQDSLRDKQREALVSYLVARPAKWTKDLDQADANDLYSHFLIDVEMSSCQLTSRIKQAIGSVQLFAQRCLLGLEVDVQTDDPKWLQWEWMKNFRVWEANRKIWLYPENWIEPELRDDKTPFFKELENELLQTDLDDAAAEQALLRYLEKLDEVARLEMVGVYEDEDKVLHVFGRTFHTPRIYYYRRREATTLCLTPWAKIELDIEGDHLIPVMWNRKLMLIWPIFTEKAEAKQIVMPNPREPMESAVPYWEIQLAWSEYQHGRWSGKNLSEAVKFKAHQAEDNIVFDRAVVPPQSTGAFNLKRKDDEDFPRDDDDGGDGDDSGGTTSGSPASNTSTAPKTLVSKEKIAFKAFASDERLIVRGYLRRDYQAARVPGDSQIACVFGEFHFFGCRKIVTTLNHSRVAGRNFSLAPNGTKFDRMWFTGIAKGLVLFDGKFPIFGLDSVSVNVNESPSIAGDPSSTVENKNPITVLAQTPTTFKLLAPHQDLQFVCDRPFFYMDGKRTFMVSSTGSSRKQTRPELGNWLEANVATAWRADFFPAAVPGSSNGSVITTNSGIETTSLTVLSPGAGGRRIAKQLTPVNVKPAFSPRTLLSIFSTTREYRFVNFHHPYLCDFVKTLSRGGIPALLSLKTQKPAVVQSFDDYMPEARVLKAYPVDEVEFQSGGAYEIYNWELFFHIPLMIADRLSKNQRFAEAQRWFHFIFDPTGSSGGEIPQRYWLTKPFHNRLSKDYETESVKTIENMIANGPSDELKAAVETWRSNPFSPHAIARLRTTAYQKTVVMKYIDNLIAWGDQLFRRETLESINEATQLYVLAAEILGRRPEVIQRNLKPGVETFNSLEPRLKPGGLGNVLEQIELLVGDPGEGSSTPDSSLAPDPPSDKMLYFCVPENYNLLAYWKTVGDRLFKIRHCMNIEGQVRQLPLFEPPIDPALLVRARAAGLSIGEVLSDIDVSLPNYRFSVMAQKANELVAEVRNLGAALLSALEKRDAEALSNLRSGQELRLLQAVRDVRVKQIDEAKTNIAALQKSHEMAEARKDYYESREFISALETIALTISNLAQIPLGAKATSEALSVVVNLIPDAKAGAPTSLGVTLGGSNIGSSEAAHGRWMETLAMLLNIGSLSVGRMAEYTRRQDEWSLQANLATKELKQVDQQLTAAEIRLAVAQQELSNHDRQIENARDVDQFLRDKFTNQDLYQFMVGQVSGLYFQSYQLAYDLSKRAERCMQHELGLKYGETSFIRFGYWDSLKKGLLAGDHLAYDLKRLEIAYLDGNIREYELTKHVSLVSLDPEQFLALKETGACEFEIPEWLFDLDTPGHYRRRIKMVSVTIPCVTGPYTSVHCKIQLLNNSFRQNADLAEGYDRRPADDTNGLDDRFIDDRNVLEAIVTSTGQNDAGLFEPGMRDERYLPFEGAGAISRWRLELPTQFKTFDYNTISDVILHLRYTARDGGNELSSGAAAAATNLLGAANTRPLFRVFSLRNEFPSEWHRFVSSPPSTSGPNVMTVDLASTRFPYFVQGREINISEATVFERTSLVRQPQIAITPGLTTPALAESTWVGPGPGLARSTSTGQGSHGPWTFGTDSDPKSVEDVFVVFTYGAS